MPGLQTLLTGLSGCLLAACTQPPVQHSDAANFQRCLQGDAWCEPDRLGAREREQILEASTALHLEHCLAGKRCNRSLLSPAERATVEAAVARLNLQACLAGHSDCRREALESEQLAQVEAGESARNLDRCLAGLPDCDRQRLSAEELAAAHQADRARNFASCQQGFASNCNPAELTAEQADYVLRRRLEANLYLCTYALIGCVDDLLTPAQRAQVAHRRAGMLR
jgi:hypothetical protein